ncbi:hypothetical protein [Neisseria sp.]|uniref:hypothetical protein n=1 Tax=Neisseria sp. TaxID=192066 RepID=UPI0026DC4205|nr:hypothetical protein [Neisseria sp.]MDO4907327.1 hypothetical protein [Neisseria sp.]
MPKINVSQSNVAQYTSSPLSSKKVLAKPATSMQMFVHYLKGRGEALNLDNLGAKKLIAASILKENAFVGSGTLSGEFIGKITKLKTGNFSLIGEIIYKFSDVFEDPYDTFNLIEGSWDPNGTPYRITDTIIHKVNAVVTAEAVNRKLRGG